MKMRVSLDRLSFRFVVVVFNDLCKNFLFRLQSPQSLFFAVCRHADDLEGMGVLI